MIIIDDREPDIIINMISNKMVMRLDVGDYIVNNILIERKSVHDFLHWPSKSYRKDRFWRQMKRMKNMNKYQPCIAIINGGHKSSLNYRSKKKKNTIKLKMFREIIQTYNFPIVQFIDNVEFINFLKICDVSKNKETLIYQFPQEYKK